PSRGKNRTAREGRPGTRPSGRSGHRPRGRTLRLRRPASGPYRRGRCAPRCLGPGGRLMVASHVIASGTQASSGTFVERGERAIALFIDSAAPAGYALQFALGASDGVQPNSAAYAPVCQIAWAGGVTLPSSANVYSGQTPIWALSEYGLCGWVRVHRSAVTS